MAVKLPAALMEWALKNGRAKKFTIFVELDHMAVPGWDGSEPLSFQIEGGSCEFNFELGNQMSPGYQAYGYNYHDYTVGGGVLMPFASSKVMARMVAVLDGGGWGPLIKVSHKTAADRAKAGYERYFKKCGGVSVLGVEMSSWDELEPVERAGWAAAFTE